MNAVLNPQAINQTIFNQPFTGPAAMTGQPVLYWTSGTKGNGKPQMAFILAGNTRVDPKTGETSVISRGQVVLQNWRGERIEAVPHVSDPRLQLNHALKEAGCWEHTPHHLWQVELDAKVTRLLAAAEKKSGGGSAKVAANQTANQEKQQPAPAPAPAGSSTPAEGAAPTLDSI